MSDEIQPIPPRPWKVVASDTAIRVASVETDESVFWIDLEGVHRPSEIARAQFIVDIINKFAPRTDGAPHPDGSTSRIFPDGRIQVTTIDGRIIDYPRGVEGAKK